MKLDSLQKLYVHELKDLYSAENQLVEALPKMCEAASNDDLKELFTNHLAETKTQVSRLETIFKAMDFEPRGHKCVAMEGLIKEGGGVMRSDIEPSVRDAALIAASQRIEHYEMAGYGTARTYAEKLGHQEAADTLQITLDEEGHANQKLTRLAERKINFLALGAIV